MFECAHACQRFQDLNWPIFTPFDFLVPLILAWMRGHRTAVVAPVKPCDCVWYGRWVVYRTPIRTCTKVRDASMLCEACNCTSSRCNMNSVNGALLPFPSARLCFFVSSSWPLLETIPGVRDSERQASVENHGKQVLHAYMFLRGSYQGHSRKNRKKKM